MKTLYIIRGLPGSGKSTLGALLAPGARFEADDYFMLSGEYVFEPAELAEAHEYCRLSVKMAMSKGVKSIAVCNVFAKFDHMRPYMTMAARFDYSVHVIECQSNFGSVHEVPEHTIQRMRAEWESFT